MFKTFNRFAAPTQESWLHRRGDRSRWRWALAPRPQSTAYSMQRCCAYAVSRPQPAGHGVVETGRGRNSVSAGDFLDWKAQNTVFQDLNAWTGAAFNLATRSTLNRSTPAHHARLLHNDGMCVSN